MTPRRPKIEVVDDSMAEVFRGMSGARRLQIASDMYKSARAMLLSHLRSEHPDWGEEQIVREAARRLSHGATAAETYPPPGALPVAGGHRGFGRRRGGRIS